MKCTLKGIICVVVFIGILMIMAPKVQATGLSVSASSTTANVGDTVTITVTGNGIAGKVNLSVSGGASLSKSSVFVDNNSDSVTAEITGEGTIYITAIAEDMADSSTSLAYAGSANTSIVVASSTSTDTSTSSNASSSSTSGTSTTNTTSTTTTTLSSNANLKNLGITPNDFSGFKVNTTTYNVTVPNDVERVTVYATLSDSNASLTGTGVHKLNVGENALSVVVTAQDGTTKKTYTINVTREAATETEEEEEDDEETDNEEVEEEEATETATNASSGDLIKLEVTGYTLSPEFSSDVFEYTLSLNGDVSSLDIITEGANHNVSIEIVGNEDLQEGENIITILVFNEETEENSTYQIIVNKTNVDLEGLNTSLNDAVNNANMIRYILLGIVIFIIICVIIFLIVRKKYIAKREAATIYEYDDEDADNLTGKFNLDEEDDLFSRVNQESNNASAHEEFLATNISDTKLDGEDNNLLNKPSLEQENKQQDDFNETSKNEMNENTSGEGTEEREEYFSTGGAKKKGKHF